MSSFARMRPSHGTYFKTLASFREGLKRDGDCARMAELAVAWVLRNPKPVALPKPAYHR